MCEIAGWDFMSPLWRLAGGFLAVSVIHIKQKLNQGLGGKIYAMEDRAIYHNFEELNRQLESASQSNLVCFDSRTLKMGYRVCFPFCVEYYQLQLKKSHYY